MDASGCSICIQLYTMEFLSDARQDVYRPSIFELIAQEQLKDLLQPAVKYVLAVSAKERVQSRGIQTLWTGFCTKVSEISYSNI